MKNNQSDSAITADALLNDLRTLVAEAEKLLAEPADGTGEDVGPAMRARFDAAQERFTDLYSSARKQVIAGGKYADKAIRENPYPSLAIAAGVGLLVGVLIGRRSN